MAPASSRVLAADRAAAGRRRRAAGRRAPARPGRPPGSAVATVLVAFVVGVAIFFSVVGEPGRRAAVEVPTCAPGSRSAALQIDFGLRIDPLSLTFVLLITGVGVADPHLLDRLHGARRRPAEVLRLPEPVRRGDAAAGARQLVRHAVRRLGGRRPRVLPADRLLVRPAGRGDRREEGVHHEPGRRRRPGAGHLPDVQGDGHHLVRRASSTRSTTLAAQSPGTVTAIGAAVAARRLRQVRPGAAAGLAARRHGGPDPGVGADPRGDHGHRRRLPDRPVRADLRPDRRTAGWWWPSSARSRCSSAASPAARRTTSRRCWPTRPCRRSATCSWPSGSAPASYALGHPAPARATASSRPGLFLGAGSVMHAMHDDVDMRRYRRAGPPDADHLRHHGLRLPGDHRVPVLRPASSPRTRSSRRRSPPAGRGRGLAARLGGAARRRASPRST